MVGGTGIEVMQGRLSVVQHAEITSTAYAVPRQCEMQRARAVRTERGSALLCAVTIITTRAARLS